ncbi:PhzF family phenazine biosynthesis protein [candidate division KSB1 bacterium]|nr:PhzF family phenazine biosynthesis protein [candidate division KSB1 bacterium]
MQIPIYQIDAFTDRLFSGNPAAVCPLTEWLPDNWLQNIASENNLSETAFYRPHGSDYDIRWFTPTVEVELCGHATLATAHVIFNYERNAPSEITFHSKSGLLRVKQAGKFLTLDFPAATISPVPLPPALMQAFSKSPTETYRSASDYLLVFDSQTDIENLKPIFSHIAEVDARGVIVTAPGNEVDFVSRFFGPQVGINEDPVTGSAHTVLAPFWSQRLNKNELRARQLSPRQGALFCKWRGARVEISGQAKTYLIGTIDLEV